MQLAMNCGCEQRANMSYIIKVLIKLETAYSLPSISTLHVFIILTGKSIQCKLYLLCLAKSSFNV